MFNILDLPKIIIKYNKGVSFNKLAKEFNSDGKTIKKYLIINNVLLRSKKEQMFNNRINYSREDIQFIIEKYIIGKSKIWIASYFNNDPKTIQKVLINNGLIIRTAGEAKTKFKNFNAFSNIDTEEKAYWLGFLAADGSISVSGQLTLQLAEKDYDHLLKFYNFMKGESKITRHITKLNDTSYIGYRVGFQNNILKKDLNNLGIIPNKTIKLKLSDDVPTYLYNHYLRGLYDGDGCFHKNKIKNQLEITLTGSHYSIIQVQNILIEKCLLNQTKIYKKENFSVLSYCGNYSSSKIRDYLYDNSTLFLERKRNKIFGLI